MSRHTPIGSGLSRSMNADLEGLSDSELVIHLDPGGIIRLTAEPTNRRLGRGEILPEVKLDAVKLFNENKPGKVVSKVDGLKFNDASLESKIDKVLSLVAIEHDEGSQIFYQAKVSLMKAVKKVFVTQEDQETTP